jgi:Ca-activated chloride channel family protein
MSFEWPYLLFGLALVPLMIALYLSSLRRRRAYAVRFTNVALLGQVMGRGPGIRRHVPPALFLLGLAALLISLARPVAVVAVPREQTTIMLVKDVSGSMQATDQAPNRMAAARTAAHAIVDALPDNMVVGLVSFSHRASLETAPTQDRFALNGAIERLSANGGTAIGEGLEVALDQLEDRPVNADGQAAPAIVVLLSDGMSTTGAPPDAAAERAQTMGIRVYTIGIGERGAVPLVNGRTPARLDETTLQNIAATTGGTYYYAPESDALTDVYQDLGSQVSWIEERTEVTALASGLGTLLMLIGGVLSLRWFGQLP